MEVDVVVVVEEEEEDRNQSVGGSGVKDPKSISVGLQIEGPRGTASWQDLGRNWSRINHGPDVVISWQATPLTSCDPQHLTLFHSYSSIR